MKNIREKYIKCIHEYSIGGYKFNYEDKAEIISIESDTYFIKHKTETTPIQNNTYSIKSLEKVISISGSQRIFFWVTDLESCLLHTEGLDEIYVQKLRNLKGYAKSKVINKYFNLISSDIQGFNFIKEIKESIDEEYMNEALC